MLIICTALPMLFSAYDDVLDHYRRYSADRCASTAKPWDRLHFAALLGLHDAPTARRPSGNHDTPAHRPA